MLALPADARALGERFFHDRGRIDEHLHPGAERLVYPAAERLQSRLEHVMVVAAPGVDRDGALLLAIEGRQRIAFRAVIDAKHDDRARLGPQPPRGAPALGVRRQPTHVAMQTLGQELGEVRPRFVTQTRRGETHGVEPERKRLRADGRLGVGHWPRAAHPRPR